MTTLGGRALNQLGMVLLVEDVAVAMAFYRDVLGAEEASRNALSEPMRNLPA